MAIMPRLVESRIVDEWNINSKKNPIVLITFPTKVVLTFPNLEIIIPAAEDTLHIMREKCKEKKEFYNVRYKQLMNPWIEKL